ncbi:MAG: hypothetical protein ACYTEE_00665 [Planctomycetota bacterium]|jgi:hypothetical protein
MTGADNNIEKKIERMNFKGSAEMHKRILDDALYEQAQASPGVWRIIMKNRIIKLAVAAAIIFAILISISQFNGSIDSTGVAWAELVEMVEQSHDEYYGELLLAMEEKDAEKATYYADALSEFWQGLNMLSELRLDPTTQFQSDDPLKLIREMMFYEDIDEQQMQQIFLGHASDFIGWLSEIEDKAWIYETVHVCKQLEEYAEEIREPGRHPEIDFSYAEHCLPSFIAYCEWFEQLPWNNPEQVMTPAILLTGIVRDLEVARRELEALQIRGVDRYVKRCIEQAEKNVLDLDTKIKLNATKKQWDLCRQLNQMIDELSGLIAYATIASGDIRQNNEFHDPERVYDVLTGEFNNKGPFVDYYIKRTDQTLNLCKQLLSEYEPIR